MSKLLLSLSLLVFQLLYAAGQDHSDQNKGFMNFIFDLSSSGKSPDSINHSIQEGNVSHKDDKVEGNEVKSGELDSESLTQFAQHYIKEEKNNGKSDSSTQNLTIDGTSSEEKRKLEVSKEKLEEAGLGFSSSNSEQAEANHYQDEKKRVKK
ncbi:unnamed protein product [Blepharisma stoltei]|uniref:Uncharacterized protein n=1 Tax=Blepharisma stoltei TaxID=1481888 RepID=A0AAU9J9G9_9CILI|nr:unnamed protein product [Blepharisma stoltei]